MLVGTKDFARSLQLDAWSCGARSVYAVLRHFDRALRYRDVKRRLGTTWHSGTAVEPMISLMRTRGLRVGYRPKMSWRELVAVLKAGAVVVVWLDGDHLAVVHGADERRVYLADPALTRCFWRSQRRDVWLRRWMRWGLVVSPPRGTSSVTRRREDSRKLNESRAMARD